MNAASSTDSTPSFTLLAPRCALSLPLPKLRVEVQLREEEGKKGRRFVVLEPTLGVRSLIDEGAFRVARLLDGQRDREAILAVLAGEGLVLEPAQVDGLLRFFDAYALLDNERTRRRLSAKLTPAEADPPLQLLPDAKWSCQSSGFCCQSSYSFGPVEEPVRLRVLQEDWSSEIPELADRLEGDQQKLFVKHEGLHFLTPIDGRCVFLSPDKKCLIHKRLGYEAKPLICRVFPFVFVNGPDGAHASMRFECRTLHTGRVLGMPAEERRDELRGYLREGASSGDLRPIVSIAPDRPVAYDEYARVERALLASLDRKDLTPEGHLLALRDISLAVASALPRHPTDEEIALALAKLDAPAPAPERAPDGAKCLRAFVSVLDELAGGVLDVYSRLSKVVQKTDFNRVLHDEFLIVLLSAVRRAADRAGIEHASPPVKNLERVEAVLHDTSAGDISGLYVDWLKNEVFGRYLTHVHGLVPALANLAARYALVRWNARIRANGRGAEKVSSGDVMDSLILVNRLFHLEYLLDPIAKLRPKLVAFFENLVLEPGPP